MGRMAATLPPVGRLAFALSLVSLAACPYSKKEHESARLEGAIEAKVIHVDAKTLTLDVLGHGHVGIIVPARKESHFCELHVTKPTRVTLEVDPGCGVGDGPYLLAPDPSGKRLAYASVYASQWNLLYFGGGKRTFDGAFHPPKGAIDWSKVPTLDEALPDLFAAQMQSPLDEKQRREALDVVLEEIASRGDGALARVLEATIDTKTTGPDMRTDKRWDTVWSDAYASLKPDARASVARALEQRLVDGALSGASANGVARAALQLDVDALLPKWSGKLGERIAARAERDAPSDFAIGVLLSRLAKADAKLAAPIGCALVSRAQPAEAASSTDVAARLDLVAGLAAVAASGLDCAAARDLDRLYEPKYKTKSPDGFGRGYCLMEGWFCPAPESWKVPAVRCTKDAARARIVARLDRPLDEVRKVDGVVVTFHQALAAIVLGAPGGVEPKRAKAIERQTYARGFDANTPLCSALEEDAGPKARCIPDALTLDDAVMCEPSATAAMGYAGVVVHYDDKKREVSYTALKRPPADAGADAR